MKEKAFPEDSFTTINDMWNYASQNYADNLAICYRQNPDDETYVEVSYARLETLVVNFGKGLADLGLKEKEPVGIIAENCLRWMICDLAVLGNGAYDIPRGTTSTREENLYILNHSETKIVILENEEKLQEILAEKEKLPHLQTMIVMDGAFSGADEKQGIYSFDEVYERGKEAPEELERTFRERRDNTLAADTATLLYTSGTTGTPKESL